MNETLKADNSEKIITHFQEGIEDDELHKYAKDQDMVIAGEYADEGFSGKNIQGRRGFRQMLDDI